jgi:hypothetical protein
MSITFSKLQMIAVGCLSATALVGAVNVPTANADRGYDGYGNGGSHAQKDGDYRDRENREPRICRDLRSRIEEARSEEEYRKVKRLEREYADNECNRNSHSHR